MPPSYWFARSLSPSFFPFFTSFFPFYPRLFPLQSLLTTCHPASPSCFWVCRSLECESNHSILLHRPLSRHGRSQNRLIFCSIAFARCTRLFIATIIASDAFPSIDHQNTLPLRGFSRFACFRLTFHKRTWLASLLYTYMHFHVFIIVLPQVLFHLC